MNALSNSIQRFFELPRVWQWAIMAIVFIVAFLLWDQTIRQLAFQWDAQADKIERDIESVQHSESLRSDLNSSKGFITIAGEVRIPGTVAEGEMALSRAVNEVLRRHTVNDDSYSMRGRRPLGKGVLSELTRGNAERVEVLSSELRFEASPETTMAIIAELETHPDVESVNSVRLTKLTTTKVKARLSIETWVIGEKPQSARNRAGGAG